jgi:hypothetical protein
MLSAFYMKIQSCNSKISCCISCCIARENGFFLGHFATKYEITKTLQIT